MYSFCYTLYSMSKLTTTVRLDPRLRKAVLKEAEKAGLSFSAILNLLLHAYAEGAIQVGVTQYPKAYLDQLGKEAEELSRLHKQGKVKGYTSAKALFDDILDR